MSINMKITEKLFGMQDLEYREFSSALMPTVDRDAVIGVRTPHLRKYAKELCKEKDIGDFLSVLPHKYYEENNLHSFIIGQIKDFDVCIAELERFLPYVDNWATCDGIRATCFKRNKGRLLPYIEKWLDSDKTYTVRFGIEMLMVYYLDDCFDESYLERAARIESGEYYVNMMIAWYFATALAKRWDSTIKYIEQNRLPLWVHNKTIQKAVESYRITEDQKKYLKTFRR